MADRNELILGMFVSTTSDIEVAKGFSKGKIILKLNNVIQNIRCGKLICISLNEYTLTFFSDEKEYLCAPFRIESFQIPPFNREEQKEEVLYFKILYISINIFDIVLINAYTHTHTAHHYRVL